MVQHAKQANEHGENHHMSQIEPKDSNDVESMSLSFLKLPKFYSFSSKTKLKHHIFATSNSWNLSKNCYVTFTDFHRISAFDSYFFSGNGNSLTFGETLCARKTQCDSVKHVLHIFQWNIWKSPPFFTYLMDIILHQLIEAVVENIMKCLVNYVDSIIPTEYHRKLQTHRLTTTLAIWLSFLVSRCTTPL